MILVVGATGNLGRKVVRTLRAAGEDVRAMTRVVSKGDELRALGARVVRGDLTDPESLDFAMNGARAVVLSAHSILGRGSDASATIEFARVPLHPRVADLARQGFVTGASARNFAGCGDAVKLMRPHDAVERALLTDPQTSGGLLVAFDATAAQEVLAVFRAEGFEEAAAIGSIEPGPPRIVVR